MRYEELIKNSHQEVDSKIKEIKNTDDDDPESLASLYDDLAETADKVATRFQKVNAAFNGEDDDQQQEQDDSDEEIDQQSKKTQSRGRQKVDA